VLKKAVFLNVMKCSLVEILIVAGCFLALVLEAEVQAANSAETLLNICQITW
jgi:hypothetical protein